MQQANTNRDLFRIFGILLLLWGIVGCTQTEAASLSTAETASGEEAPTEVTAVRDAAIDFLRASAAVCVPPEGVPWRMDQIENEATEGANVYRFTNEDCVLTVAYPQPPPADTTYYVAYNNAATAFCWQAFISGSGEILSTGYEQIGANVANPAATYCEQQGHVVEIITKEDGTPCAACVFPDDSACNIWEYFYGTCQPGDNPLPME